MYFNVLLITRLHKNAFYKILLEYLLKSKFHNKATYKRSIMIKLLKLSSFQIMCKCVVSDGTLD